jgi:hypothetical protein
MLESDSKIPATEPAKRTLADILADESLLFKAIEDNEGEVLEWIEKALHVTTADLESKIDSYAFRIRKLRAHAEFWKAEANVAYEIQKRFERLADRIEDTIIHFSNTFHKPELIGQKSHYVIKPAVDNVSLKPNLKLADLPTYLTKEGPRVLNKDYCRRMKGDPMVQDFCIVEAAYSIRDKLHPKNKGAKNDGD